jgi:predicted nucleotidyltransferase
MPLLRGSPYPTRAAPPRFAPELPHRLVSDTLLLQGQRESCVGFRALHAATLAPSVCQLGHRLLYLREARLAPSDAQYHAPSICPVSRVAPYLNCTPIRSDGLITEAFCWKGYTCYGMAASLRQHIGQIERLCQQYGVARLELIGSALSEDTFDPALSDIDLLVEFEGNESLFARYIDLKLELEILLQRPVDLIMKRAIRNPYFLQEVETNRVVLYESARSRLA